MSSSDGPRHEAIRVEATFDYVERQPGDRDRSRAGGLVAGMVLVASLAAAGWAMLSKPAVDAARTVEQFVAAVNRGAVGAAMGRLASAPGDLNWPVTWTSGQSDGRAGIRADGPDDLARVLAFFDSVGGHLELTACTDPGDGLPDGIVECAYRTGDDLSALVGEDDGTGMISFEVRAGRIGGIEVRGEQDVRAPRWQSFEEWLGFNHRGEFELLVADDVEYADNGVPLHWVTNLSFSAESAARLLGLALEFVADGANTPSPEVGGGGLVWSPVDRGRPAAGLEMAAFPGGFASLDAAGLRVSTADGGWTGPGRAPAGVERLSGVPAGLLAYGSSVHEVWFSEDGAVWERVDLPDANGLPWMVGEVAVAEAGVLVASGGRAWMSPDGRTFSQAVRFPFELGPWGCQGIGPPYALAGSSSGFLAVPVGDGTRRTDVQASADGDNWAPVGAVGAFGEGALVCDVAGWGNGYAAVGSSIWLSEDGRSWVDVGLGRFAGPDPLTMILAGEAGLLALGPGPQSGGWFSADGESWRPLPGALAGSDGFMTTPWGAVGQDLVLAGDAHAASGLEGATVWLGRPAG